MNPVDPRRGEELQRLLDQAADQQWRAARWVARAHDPTYAGAIPQTSILQRAVGHLLLARQHLQHAYRLADTPGQQAYLAKHLRWLDTVTAYVAELRRALDEQARASVASVRDEGLLHPRRGGTERADGMTRRGRQGSLAEAVLYVVAFALAGAVISMMMQQTAAGTIQGSRVLLASVLTALAGAAITTWFVPHRSFHVRGTPQ